MSFLNQLQIVVVPLWIRYLIGVMLVLSIIFSVSLIVISPADERYKDLANAGSSLLGIVLPITIAAALAAGGSHGEESLRIRTAALLRETVPFALTRLPMGNMQGSPASVRVSYLPGGFQADYTIAWMEKQQNKVARIRVELNVRRANVNLIFPMSFAQEVMLDRFPHSFQVKGDGAQVIPLISEGGYLFNPKPLVRSGLGDLAIVASTRLPADVLWNPAERLFFAQDLMLMVRSFVDEAPEMFDKQEVDR